MSVTLKQIAEIAGVSRGTVDRALYDRGRVNPDVARRIKQIAQELGYQPNRAGRALALAKNPLKIGVIVQSVETPFMQLVLDGIFTAQKELDEMGIQVCIKQIRSIDAGAVEQALDALTQEGCNGIALLPADNESLKRKLRELNQTAGLPIVTFNSDIPDAPRMCFVGQNDKLSGRTAAGLMNAIVHSPGNVLIITGHLNKQAMRERVQGFREEAEASFPRLSLLPTTSCEDDAEIAYALTCGALRQAGSLAGVYICTNGQEGVCRALAERGLTGKIPVIGFDLTPDNCRALREGRIDFLIGQDSAAQGYRAVMLLFDYLFKGEKPPHEFLYTDIVIKTKYLV